MSDKGTGIIQNNINHSSLSLVVIGILCLFPQQIMAQNVAIVNNEEINGVRVIAQQASSQGFSFSSPINLSNTPGNAILKRSSLDPHLAVAGSNVYLLWQDNTPGKYQIFFKRSTDGGASFDYAINLSKDTGPSSVGTINIATSGSNVYVVWEEDTGSGYELFFRRSTDKGASFGDTTNLGGNTNSLGALPKIVASRGNVYIIWEHTSTGNQSIFLLEVQMEELVLVIQSI